MMRRIDVLLRIAFVVICLVSAATAARQIPTKGQGLPADKKILIVYLSRTNNTKAVADIIHEKVGGKLVALELQTPYPADYHATVQQVVRENETGYLPPPMKSFLHQYSFRGKTIIPFNSNGGYGPGSTFQTVRELCPQSTVLQGFSTRGGLERDGQLLAIKDARAEEVRKEVESWLRTVGIRKGIARLSVESSGSRITHFRMPFSVSQQLT